MVLLSYHREIYLEVFPANQRAQFGLRIVPAFVSRRVLYRHGTCTGRDGPYRRWFACDVECRFSKTCTISILKFHLANKLLESWAACLLRHLMTLAAHLEQFLNI